MTAMTDLSHVGPDGAVRMVDVGGKPLSRRRAVARATVLMAPETVARLGELPKGDALTTAQLAGIMAAKRTSELIPLCHPLPLTSDRRSTLVGRARTGVEIEADGRDDGADRRRDGGADGRHGRRPDRLRHGQGDRQVDDDHRSHARREDEGSRVRAAVLTVSDGVHHGTREDRSGDTLAELLAGEGFEVERRVVPDEAEAIAAAIDEPRLDAAPSC